MIQINLLRVSPDSHWLEFSVECPVGYLFNTLYITRYNVITKLYDLPAKDCSALLAATTTKEVMRIATSAFGAETTMYKVEFGVTPTEAEAPDLPNAIGICSNVNFVYANMLDLILQLNDCCLSCEDFGTLIRNHMILYAHSEAMRLERYPDAEYFYNIIWNLFTNCGPTSRQTNLVTNPCNCK